MSHSTPENRIIRIDQSPPPHLEEIVGLINHTSSIVAREFGEIKLGALDNKPPVLLYPDEVYLNQIRPRLVTSGQPKLAVAAYRPYTNEVYGSIDQVKRIIEEGNKQQQLMLMGFAEQFINSHSTSRNRDRVRWGFVNFDHSPLPSEFKSGGIYDCTAAPQSDLVPESMSYQGQEDMAWLTIKSSLFANHLLLDRLLVGYNKYPSLVLLSESLPVVPMEKENKTLRDVLESLAKGDPQILTDRLPKSWVELLKSRDRVNYVSLPRLSVTEKDYVSTPL